MLNGYIPDVVVSVLVVLAAVAVATATAAAVLILFVVFVVYSCTLWENFGRGNSM